MRIPKTPPSFKEIWQGRFRDDPGESLQLMTRKETLDFVRSVNDRYLHWDKFRYQPLPPGLDHMLAWAAVDMSRSTQLQSLPLSFFKMGRQLRYWIPPQQHEWLSIIDQKAGGYIGTKYRRSIPDDNERYLFNSLMEEAIASSQLEGASTTREVAKEMLRAQRRPRDEGEQMILNNYKAILEIREAKKEQLTAEFLCHLHEVITEGTLKDPGAAGRFRLPHEEIHVADVMTGEVIHDPPPSETIEDRIKEVCDFANTRSKPFVHPVIKAMALHFAIGFIHPFVDGNGRTARALFYWYMLKHGYWLFEYLPISRILIAAPARYARAYLYTETDGGDLTYFNQYHLKVVLRAINELHEYLEEQQRLLDEADKLLDRYPDLNHRQRSLLQNALKHPSHRYTVREHEGKFRVTYNTARSDLLDLEGLGLFEKSKAKKGKEWIFRPAPDLMKHLKTPKKRSVKRSGKPKKKDSGPSLGQRSLFDPELFDLP